MKLIIADFDGTLANTFEVSPNGIGIHEAYNTAIQDIFGRTGIGIYAEIGGLQNRSPGELIVDILSVAKNKSLLIDNAHMFFRNRNGNLLDLVPEGKGAELIWDNSQPETVISEMLVLRKLEILIAEVGEEWPRPFNGVLPFFKRCYEEMAKVVLLTSGHELFVKKVFSCWGIDVPGMITDDDLRGKIPYLSKPNPALIKLALEQSSGGDPVCYIGDDPIKDGQLAQNSGLPFLWFNPSKEKPASGFPENTVEFDNWTELSDYLFLIIRK